MSVPADLCLNGSFSPVVIPETDRGAREPADLAFLRAIASRLAGAPPLAEVLNEVVEFVSAVVKCDSCFVYVLEGNELFLRASKNPHREVVDRLKMRVGQGITGWVAKHREPVVVAQRAYEDPRFRLFSELPEDRFEAFLSVPIVSGGRLVGVINLQNRSQHRYNEREIGLVATIGFLVGAEIERARLESENSQLLGKLEARTLVERAKGILQRDLKVSEEDAYRVMQRESQRRRKSMKDIAAAVILSDSLRASQSAV
jgi:uroporphyrinogen-III synthase